MRKHYRQLDISVGISGPHGFAVRFNALRRGAVRRPPHPAPNVRDDRETPLVIGHGMREGVQMICPTAQRCRLRQINTTGKSGAVGKILSSDKQLLAAPVIASVSESGL
jgi:hypothetical protein